MGQETKRIIRAIATLVGTIIGAGIFGLPYVISRSGVLVGVVYFLVLGLVIALLHGYFAKIVLAIKSPHRFPGFANALLGRSGKEAAALLGILGGWLTLVIYIILGGVFLNLLVGPYIGGSDFLWSLLFAAAGFLIVMGGLPFVTGGEFIMTTALIILILIFVVVGVPKVVVANLVSYNSDFLLQPYGVILFALSGLVAIPQLEDMVGDGKKRAMYWSVVSGTVLATVLTALFVIVVVGVSGSATTTDALSGLRFAYGNWVIPIGALFGFLAVITSFLTTLVNQVDTFVYDYRVPRLVSNLLGLGIPVLVFLWGAHDYIKVMGLAGGLTGGLTGLLLVIMYLVLLKKQGLLRLRWFVPILVAIIFFCGAIAEVAITFVK